MNAPHPRPRVVEDVAPDRSEAERFILALAGSVDLTMVFQTFTDAAHDSPDPLAAVRVGTLADHWAWLVSQHRRGAGIFVQVNGGAARGKKSITSLRSLFVDDDAGGVEPEALNLTPSIVVRSKAGCHVYWKLRPGEPLDDFEPAQIALAATYNTDPAMKNLDRVLRVPGFHHQKDPSDPYMVRIVQTGDAVYSIREVLEGNGAKLAQPAPTLVVNDVPNPVLDALRARGLHKSDLGGGKHDVTCPWLGSHTGAVNSGAVYFEPSPENAGAGGFKCQHAHCVDRNVGALREFLKPASQEDDFSSLSVGSLLAHAEQRLEGGVQYLPTGWPRLDKALGGGFLIPSLNVMGAPPKAHKSTHVQITATNHVEQGGVAYCLDVENGRHRFLRRLLCRRSRLGSRDVALALKDHRAGVFTSRDAFDRWQEAKEWMTTTIGKGMFAEFVPPENFETRVQAARRFAGDRPLLVVVDSLQKLPMDFADRRSSVDKWVRLFERLRHEYEAVFLVVSEVSRDNRTGGYRTGETSLKESGGIEYAADVAMVMDRTTADDEDEDAIATLKILFARDCDEDPRGIVASYEPQRPHHGLEEVDPVAIKRDARRKGAHGPEAKARNAAADFLADLLADGAETVEAIFRKGKASRFSESTLRRAGKALGVLPCTVLLKSGWKLPETG